jgi:hypothetical protein
MPEHAKPPRKPEGDDPIFVTDTQVGVDSEGATEQFTDEVQVVNDDIQFDGTNAKVNVSGRRVTSVEIRNGTQVTSIPIGSGVSFEAVFLPLVGHNKLLSATGSGDSSTVSFHEFPKGTSLDPGSGPHTGRKVRSLGKYASIDLSVTGIKKKNYVANDFVIHYS